MAPAATRSPMPVRNPRTGEVDLHITPSSAEEGVMCRSTSPVRGLRTGMGLLVAAGAMGVLLLELQPFCRPIH